MSSATDSDFTSSKSILLVDDNPHGLVARKHVLAELGYTVTTALSAEEALHLIDNEGHFFHLVVTDFRMIAMDGIELIARLKVICPTTKTVLLSGFVEPLGLTEQSTGADAVISKSASEVGQLTRTVRNLLAQRVPRKPAASQKSAAIAPSMVKSV
jgi:CheY-like chemotaxis protein